MLPTTTAGRLGKQSKKRGKRTQTPAGFPEGLLEIATERFCLDLTGLILAAWPHLAAREAGSQNLCSRWPMPIQNLRFYFSGETCKDKYPRFCLCCPLTLAGLHYISFLFLIFPHNLGPAHDPLLRGSPPFPDCHSPH